jgi:hypothetical protein
MQGGCNEYTKPIRRNQKAKGDNFGANRRYPRYINRLLWVYRERYKDFKSDKRAITGLTEYYDLKIVCLLC